MGLDRQARTWRTPDAPTSGGVRTRKSSIGKGHQIALGEQVAQWPTPAARDSKNPNALCYADRGGKRRGEQLPNFVRHYFPPVLPISTDGARSSGGGRKLNPAFVETLMGLPLGWTASEPLETELFLSWLRTHSARLDALCSADTELRLVA